MDKKDVEKMLRINAKAKNTNEMVILLNRNKIKKEDCLFVLTDELYDEKLCFKAIKDLLYNGLVDINVAGDFGYNFIQNAIYEGYSSDFIVDLIAYCSSFNLNVNHRDEDGDTILHTAIYADDFKGDIYKIYTILIKCGFDSRLKDNAGRNIVEAMMYEKKMNKKFSNEEINDVVELYNKEVERLTEEEKKEDPIDKVLENMGYDLNDNKEVLKKEFAKLGASYDKYLFRLTDELHNELSCFAAIKSLLSFTLCKVNEVDENGYNFIQNAMYAGYGTAFINGCIDASNDGPCKLNVNHNDEDGDTMLHTAIYCNDVCVLDIASVYETLLKYGFDSSLKDNDGRSIIDAMAFEKKRCGKFSAEDIKNVERIYNNALGIGEAKSFTEKELDNNKKLGKEGLENFLKKCR